MTSHETGIFSQITQEFQQEAYSKVVTVDPKYTSQTCNVCGHVSKENRKTQSKFECMACGHTDHADLNAFANILASGIGATGRGRSIFVRDSTDLANGYVKSNAQSPK